MGYRPSYGLSLKPKGCQRTLLPSQFGRPQLLTWKNNLTSLSRVYNLYFIASVDKILVFEPEFPSQELGLPKMTIRPPLSSPDLPGHHSVDYPHAINQLLVDRLGDLEIVVIACDDGDVIAYLVKDIQHAIDCGVRKIRRSGQCDDGNNHLRPILHDNVGKSAWGLAVHRKARMLAVSANTKDITIYSFALTDEQGRSSPSCEEGNGGFNGTKESITGPVFLYDRAISRRMILRTDSVASNIPNISFCNTSEDPHGRFLASTNIVGVTTLWDLQHKCSVEELVTRTRSPRGAFEHWNLQLSGKHGGWNIVFLDKRSFRTAESETDAMTGLFSDVDASHSQSEQWTSTEDCSEDSYSEEDGLLLAPGTPHPNSTHFLSSTLGVSNRLDHSGGNSSEYGESVTDRSQFWMRVMTGCGAGQLSPLPNCPILQTAIRDVFLFQPEYDTSGRTRLIYKKDSRIPSDVMANRIVPGLGPILGFDSSSDLPQPFCPIQILHNPLAESLAFSRLIPRCERLNMVNDIPELGVVLIGCGKGRAAIIQLIKFPASRSASAAETDPSCYRAQRRQCRRSSREPQANDGPTNVGEEWLKGVPNSSSYCQSWKSHGRCSQNQRGANSATALTRTDETYTFRVVHKIPLPEQEKNGQRPPIPLVGTAVGPVQGSTRRWRIMLTYLDGTILTYEICRANDEGDCTTGGHEVHV